MRKTFTCELNPRKLGVIKCEAVSNLGSVYVGRAICSPQDQFSLTTGMRIAEIRAELKQLNLIRKNSKERLDVYRSQYKREQKLFNRIWDKIEDLEDELEFLTN